jgi:hypothetical protein
MKKTSIILLIISFAFASCADLLCSFRDDGVKTNKKEYAPSVLLKKYEHFKDLSAAIDKKDADILMYKEDISTIESKDSYYASQRKSELMGIISVRNQLCAEYNSAMAKENYAFCNVGNMPQSNLAPLPREYKPYVSSLR